MGRILVNRAGLAVAWNCLAGFAAAVREPGSGAAARAGF